MRNPFISTEPKMVFQRSAIFSKIDNVSEYMSFESRTFRPVKFNYSHLYYSFYNGSACLLPRVTIVFRMFLFTSQCFAMKYEWLPRVYRVCMKEREREKQNVKKNPLASTLYWEAECLLLQTLYVNNDHYCWLTRTH